MSLGVLVAPSAKPRDDLRSHLDPPARNLLAGAPSGLSFGAMVDLIVDNPFTSEEAARRPLADRAAMDRLLDGARLAARGWAQTPIAERVALCLRAIEEMEGTCES